MQKNVPFIHHYTIADKEERYVLVTCEIQPTPITLLNIYGPNWDDPDIFRQLYYGKHSKPTKGGVSYLTSPQKNHKRN